MWQGITNSTGSLVTVVIVLSKWQGVSTKLDQILFYSLPKMREIGANVKAHVQYVSVL